MTMRRGYIPRIWLFMYVQIVLPNWSAGVLVSRAAIFPLSSITADSYSMRKISDMPCAMDEGVTHKKKKVQQAGFD